MATHAVDFWRQHNWFNTIRQEHGFWGVSSRPEDNTFIDCDLETMGASSGHIYVIYAKQGSNRFYIGSTFQGSRKRLAWHLDECYKKLASSKLYMWMRGQYPTRAEAQNNLVLCYIYHVHFHKAETSMERKSKAVHEIEKEYINSYFDVRRILNTRDLSPENRAKINKNERLRSSLEEVLELLQEDDVEKAVDVVKDLLNEL